MATWKYDFHEESLEYSRCWKTKATFPGSKNNPLSSHKSYKFNFKNTSFLQQVYKSKPNTKVSNRRHRDFPHATHLHNSLANILHQGAVFLRNVDPVIAYHCHPNFVIYIKGLWLHLMGLHINLQDSFFHIKHCFQVGLNCGGACKSTSDDKKWQRKIKSSIEVWGILLFLYKIDLHGIYFKLRQNYVKSDVLVQKTNICSMQ